MVKNTRYVHPVDAHVGRRLKAKREKRGISQNELASAVALTFQQIQKYEKGTNRVSSSKLYDFAKILNVGVEFFFRGLEESYTLPYSVQTVADANPALSDKRSEYQSEKEEEEIKLLNAFRAIENQRIKKNVLDLLYSLGL